MDKYKCKALYWSVQCVYSMNLVTQNDNMYDGGNDEPPVNVHYCLFEFLCTLTRSKLKQAGLSVCPFILLQRGRYNRDTLT